ncbi:MAG: antitoxin of toxin-antitoxin stability system [Elusimicrobia bacterium]|nr:MAG: antitoxin of toxin-antitoxin stability system [Elusimicrobiota bacterium]
MATFNVYAAKSRLSHLIDEAASGKEVIIARAGKPIAKIVALGGRKRRLGLLAGKLKVPADFDAPLSGDVLSGFEGD